MTVRRAIIILLAITLLATTGWVACGGGGGRVTSPGTQAGQYTVALTATSGAISHAIPSS